MSVQFIQKYYDDITRSEKFGGTKKESTISKHFSNLLDEYCRLFDLALIDQESMKTPKGKFIRPDGTVKNKLRIPIGYWESKDQNDTLEREIDKKFSGGYPNNNILFEDSLRAILYQNGAKVGEVLFNDATKLDALLRKFLTFQHEEAKDFAKAVERFGLDLPHILQALREMIVKQEASNNKFLTERRRFLDLCKTSINDNITIADINEMLIQHILTEELFLAIFSESQFHRENTIAKSLYEVEATFFFGTTKREMLNAIRHFYEVIKREANKIIDHHEKQFFLKVMYETFYKAYNPKAADRLGIVYTPLEIVRFQIEAVDFLLTKYFKKSLSDKNIEILDPATGTGTYICDLIDYLPPQYLVEKYRSEIHANEVELLPYYIANLNIEYTYQQKMKQYAPFENICFVDTLDNLQGLRLTTNKHGKTGGLFSVTYENTERIERQNKRKISVIIGNPPYNANQQNENDNNKNREYPFVDKRIKETFIDLSKAQKTKVYDMYARFYRWAMDRLEDKGVISFITNRSFVDSRTFDGFRAYIEQNFDAAYIVDTHSDVRANPKISGTGHNVFGIQTGVALLFLIRKNKTQTNIKEKETRCHIQYIELDDFMPRTDKITWFKENPFHQLPFQSIEPDKNHNWLNITDNDFEELLPLADKDVKAGKGGNALFKLFSLGVVTARDEWVYDFNSKHIEDKVKYLIDVYNEDLKKLKGKTKDEIRSQINYSIKWTRAVKNDLANGKEYTFDKNAIIDSMYRPFVKQKLYFHKELNEMQYQLNRLFIKGKENTAISFSGEGSSKPFQVLIQNTPYSHDALEKTQCLPFYTYDSEGKRIENLTDWGLTQFQTQYKDKKITKESIFAYVYAVLHTPQYRAKYEQNLKREFPRIPFYADFKKWAKWGQQLLDLHLNYETAPPYPLRIETTGKKKEPKPKLALGINSIIVDENTTLADFPMEALGYKLGNRTAIGWILDQYKESKPSDPTILAQFNHYKLADHKSKVIDLLQRVTTVSVETVKIIKAMEQEKVY